MLIGANLGFMGTNYHANAVDYNGSTDYLTRTSAFVGGSNSSQCILSLWFRLDGGDGSALYLFTADVGAGANTTFIRKLSSNKFDIITQNTGATSIFEFSTSNTYTTSSTWHHLLASWDTGFSSGSRLSNLYIDNSSDKSIVTDTGSSFSNNFATEATFAIGELTGANFWNGGIAEFYLASGQYLDFSNSSNRAKFIIGGKPVYLGTDGSIPTGTAPTIYLPNIASTVGTNAGTGGNFTINGSPAAASTSPSD